MLEVMLKNVRGGTLPVHVLNCVATATGPNSWQARP